MEVQESFLNLIGHTSLFLTKNSIRVYLITSICNKALYKKSCNNKITNIYLLIVIIKIVETTESL